MRAFIEQENQVHGPSKDLEELLPPFFYKVIPRLLRPLQAGGRRIKPVLVHGDLWYGNIAKNAKTGGPVIFDPSVFWAHNECQSSKSEMILLSLIFDPDDLGNFNISRYRLGREWMEEYHKHFPISAPEEDHEDRNLLYAM